ncbi:anthranilate phosphoribosyltransferase [bacterium]|nr:anthranilate phosphoribosyltransferase [bacterium]
MEANLILTNLINGNDLSFDEASWMMNQFMDGGLTNSQMAAMLVALRIKKETITEITACASIMREKSTKIPIASNNLIDTCGTGGDSSGSFNISTTVAFLLAGGGYRVAKHGNRSMTSKSGSADLLEALGVNLDLTPEQIAECIDKTNIGFLFAPVLHSAMKNVVPVRKELAVRTVFNILGPLTNPAGAEYQVLGLFSTELVPIMIRVLKELGSKAAFTFAGLSGLDEVCIQGDTQVAQLKTNGDINEFLFDPERYGFKKYPLESIRGGSPKDNAEITLGVLGSKIQGAKRDVVALNAGFAISIIDDCSLEDAFKKSRLLLDEGVGLKAIDQLKSVSSSYTK